MIKCFLTVGITGSRLRIDSVLVDGRYHHIDLAHRFAINLFDQRQFSGDFVDAEPAGGVYLRGDVSAILIQDDDGIYQISDHSVQVGVVRYEDVDRTCYLRFRYSDRGLGLCECRRAVVDIREVDDDGARCGHLGRTLVRHRHGQGVRGCLFPVEYCPGGNL